jgi:hypothetical protein
MIRPTVHGTHRFRLVGRNEATTFTGFCTTHDAELFADIDTGPSTPPDARRVVLHTMRATAMECWEKLNIVKVHGHLLSLCRRKHLTELTELLQLDIREFEPILFEEVMGDTMPGYAASGDRLAWRFGSYRRQLETNKFHLTPFVVFSFNGAPRIGASISSSPTLDFRDRVIAYHTPTGHLADLAVTVTPWPDRVDVALAYHRKDSGVLAPILVQLKGMSDSERGLALSRFLIIHGENIAFAPAFIDSIGDQQRAEIELGFTDSLHGAIPYADAPAIDFLT